jgi:aspartate/methionine/tyrosine aminotransferase
MDCCSQMDCFCLRNITGQYTSGACSVAQKAAEAAYTGNQSCVETMRAAFERRRNLWSSGSTNTWDES